MTQRLAKPASSAAAAMAPEPRPQLGRAAVPGERRDLQPEAQRQRIVALAGGGGRRGDQGGRHDLDVARLVHAVEALVGQRRQRRRRRPAAGWSPPSTAAAAGAGGCAPGTRRPGWRR